MEPSSSEQQFCLRWNNHKSNLLTEFNELLQNEAFTDVTLVVEDGPSFIKCHKMVLAACSTYFQALFIHLPSNEQHPVIVLKDVKYSEMKAILEYMYQGEVSIAQDQLSELFKVADLLKVKGLVDHKSSSRPRDSSLSPPPAISTSTERTYSDSINNDNPSPPHSTSSSPYYTPYGKSPSHQSHSAAQHIAPVWNHLSSLSLAAQTVMNTPMAPRGTPIFPRMYETEESNIRKKMSGLLVNRDTPILRTVLGQGHADSSQGAPMAHGDNAELHRSNSNGSANDANDGRRSSMDFSGLSGHSPYPPEATMEEDEKKHLPMGQQNRKHKEWKRYKQYSKEDMDQAIAAVKSQKMTALKAAVKFRIPSRTLYDKVKKMGIITHRNGRRHMNASGAHFPHGIGGNRNGTIYSGIPDHDSETDQHSQSIMESSSALLQMAYGNIREQSGDDEIGVEGMRRSSSPDEELHNEEEQMSDDHVQDLSINRKNVIVPPINHPGIKEEKPDGPQN